MSVLFLTVPRRRHRIRAAVVAGALVAGLGTVLTTFNSAVAATPAGYRLPLTGIGDVVVDGTHQRVFIADPDAGKVIAVGYDGTVVGTAGKLPDVTGLALSPDENTLYAAVPGADAVVAINTESVTESARYSTGADTQPTYLALAGGKLWFGYVPDGNRGNLGSLDPEIGESSVSLGYNTDLYGAPMLTGASDVLAAADVSGTGGAVKVLDVAGASPEVLAYKSLAGNIIQDLRLSPDGDRLFTAASGVSVDSWRSSDLAASTSYGTESGEGWARTVAVAPDGRLATSIVGYGDDPQVRAYLPDATTPIRGFTLADTDATTSPQDEVVRRGLAWEPNGTRLFAVSSIHPSTYRLVVLTDATKSEPRLTVKVPAKAARAKKVAVSGSLTATTLPLPAGVSVTVTRTDGESPNGKSLGVKKLDAKGRFSFTDTPAAGGKITYRARYAGDATHAAVSAAGSVKVPRDASKLTLSGNRKVFSYGKKVTFTAKLGKAYKNRTVEIYADPYGADKKKRLVKKGVVNSKGTLKAAVKLTRNTTVTAVYTGDTRTAAKTVKAVAFTKVRVATSMSKHYRTRKIGSTRYYVFHKRTDPVVKTTMTAAKGRSQLLTLEYYYDGAWQFGGSEYFGLTSKGKSSVTLGGTPELNLKMRVRSAYIRNSSGDKLNATTRGPWRYFIFTR